MQLFISAGLIAAVVLWGLISPATLDSVFGAALVKITHNFGWLYLWLVLGMVLLAFYLAFSRFGDLKLGDEDDEPEFSTGAWFSMLFAAGMGIGLVFWGVAEPVSHYSRPPPGFIAGTPEAASAAMRYAFFHWGLHPWAIYGIVGLAISFFTFRRKALPLVSSATEALPWRFMRHLSPTFNVLAIVATAFGVAASLGMGATQINSGLADAFGVPLMPWVQAVIIVVTAVLFITSSVTGVDRGIKWLSIGNLVLAGVLAIAVFTVGPTIAIVETLTNTLGGYMSEFVRMSLHMTPFRTDSWVGDWTLFYWAWWLAWSPYVGLFIARVSRGRTVRQFILGTVLAPTLVGFVWFAVFGGSALNLAIFQGAPLVEAVQANVSSGMYALFDALPLGGLMSVVATVLVFVFFVTSGDSATLVLGTMSTGGNPNPSARVKIIWGVLVAAIALSLLLAGGLKAIQTATIVFALPFAVVLLLMAVSVTIAIRQDWDAEQRRDKAIRRKMRELVEHPPAGSSPPPPNR